MQQATAYRRWGSVPAGLALSAEDIGQCYLGSDKLHYCTWGRNLNYEDAEWFQTHTVFAPVKLGGDTFELLIPDDMVAPLLPILVGTDDQRQWLLPIDPQN
jgi:hypothetical protein